MFAHDGGMVFGGVFMWLFWLLLLVLLVVIVRLIFGGSGGLRGTRGATDDDPLTILRKRYARGEIDAEEFRRRREELEK